MGKCLFPFILLIIVVSCDQVVNEGDTYVTTIESRDKSEEPMEVKIMEMLPIKEYGNYVAARGMVFGINGSNLEPIEFKNDEGGKFKPLTFFKIKRKIFFSIQTFEIAEGEDVAKEKITFYSQKNDTISILAALPEYPESERQEYETGVFQVKKTSYGDIATSTIMRGPAQEAYLCIDGAVAVDSGIWFSVPESYSVRLKGVYFWPKDTPKRMAIPEGRIF